MGLADHLAGEEDDVGDYPSFAIARAAAQRRFYNALVEIKRRGGNEHELEQINQLIQEHNLWVQRHDERRATLTTRHENAVSREESESIRLELRGLVADMMHVEISFTMALALMAYLAEELDRVHRVVVGPHEQS